MPEARVMLIHSASGQALCKEMRGDCPPNLVGPVTDDNADEWKKAGGRRNYAWKLEVIKKNKASNPSELYIRNDWHPQRFLTACDGDLMLLSGRTSGVIWQVEYHSLKTDEGNTYGKLVSFRNKDSGQYLTVMNERLKLGTLDTWMISPMSFTAFTPLGAVALTSGITLGVVVVAGTAIVGASYMAASGVAAAAQAETAAAGTYATAAATAAEVAAVPVMNAHFAALGEAGISGILATCGSEIALAQGGVALAAAGGNMAGAVAGYVPTVTAALLAAGNAAGQAALLVPAAGVTGIIVGISAGLAIHAGIDSSDPGLYVMKC